VGEPALAEPGLDVAQVAPRLVVLKPGMYQRLLHRESLPHLNLEKVVDEVHSLGANVGPGVGRVHEVGVLDLLVDILVLVEGKHA